MFWELAVLWGILLIGLVSHHTKQNIENEYTRTLIRGVHNRLRKIEGRVGLETLDEYVERTQSSAPTAKKEMEE